MSTTASTSSTLAASMPGKAKETNVAESRGKNAGIFHYQSYQDPQNVDRDSYSSDLDGASVFEL